jgi:choline-sulfatase
MKQPNILLLFTDQQRFDTIAALGNPVIKTPAMDRIVREGVAFTSAYSPSPVCVPARCSLHYGQYPMRTGCYDNPFVMPDDRPSFMQLLTDAGYRTHGIGKCHFRRDAKALRGFQSRETQEEEPPRASDDYTCFLEKEGWGELPEPHAVRGEMYYVPQVSQMPQRLHPTQWVGDRTVAFIEAQKDSGQPWFLFSSYVHPHPPFAPPVPWHKLYRSFDMPLPKVPQDVESLQTYANRKQNRYKGRDQGIDNNLVRNIKAHYYACISFVDYQVGRTLEALERTGQLANTLVLLTADHGEHLGDYNCFGKRSMHDSCARVPMLAWLPGRFDGGVRCDVPASLVDVMPTVLAAAGCDTAGAAMDGVDLLALLDGDAGREAVFSQYSRGATAIYTMVTERWKYAYSAPDDREYLFDRRSDPGETRNRSGLPTTRLVVKQMRAKTIAWLAQGGETDAFEGDKWKVYPPTEVSTDPDAEFITQDRPGFVLDLPGYTDAGADLDGGSPAESEVRV